MGEAWQLVGPQLLPFGEMDAGGGVAQAYTVDPLSPGNAISFALEPVMTSLDVDDPMVATVSDEGGLGLGIGVLSLVVVGMTVFALWRRDVAPVSDHRQALPDELRDEVQTLAALDRRFEAGDLAPAVYEEQRRTVKARIRARLEQVCYRQDHS
jgi:hypothetical protein